MPAIFPWGLIMPSRFTALIINFGLIFVSAIVGVLLIEIGLWVFAPQKMRDEHEAYRTVPGTPYFELQPNYRKEIDDRVGRYTFATNHYGIRDREFDTANSHSHRVLFLGDSQTMGYGVDLEQAFVKQFERHLREATRQDWQALNLAIAGGSTFDELYAYRTKGLPLTHRYVILGFYIGNDVFDNIEFQTRPFNSDHPGRRTLEQRTRMFLASHSQLWNLLVDQLHFPVFYRLGIRHGPGPFLELLSAQEPQEIQYGWQLTFAVLKELQDLVASQHAQLILLLIPHKIQLRYDAFESAAALYGISTQDLETDRPQRILRRFAKNEQIQIIDLLDYLESDERLYYFASDIHLNANGHSAIGQVLAKAFLKWYERDF